MGVNSEKSVTRHMNNGNSVTTNVHEKSVTTTVSNASIEMKHTDSERSDIKMRRTKSLLLALLLRAPF